MIGYHILAFILSVLVALIATQWLLKICHRFQLYDQPSIRKIHQSGVPRLGGVIYVPTAAFSFGLVYFLMHLTGEISLESIKLSSVMTAGGALLLYSIGILDDLTDCKATIKLIMQLLVMACFVASGLYIDTLYGFCGINELPLWISYPLTIFIGVLIINAINLIDGIDGLACIISLIALVAYGILFARMHLVPPTFTLIISALAGALCVFLYYNIWGSVESKTKIFMGDSGSLLLGVVLTYFTLKYMMSTSGNITKHSDGFLYAYSLVLVPSFDLCRVALCRLSKGHHIFHADKTHIHHKLMRAGFSMHTTLLFLITLQIAYILLNIGMNALGCSMEIIVTIDVITFTLLNLSLKK